ncbi:alpha/beta hydrolase [Chryseolinea lacunae]|uniref:Alpha/beta hydrolase n=1 Tax=Chryseolinea lacunae TaxID=2801331 RepID=A0ABS1KMS7_9BACT|nr:alpha/beta hydrolase [Chryseolinea lacunae]MBL0740644.1 alpha/beta hydrolase [Chryseolinea lacunae]
MRITFAIVLLLLARNVSATTDSLIHKRVIYKVADTSSLHLDIFYAPGALKQKNNTALVFIHGGGWAYGSPSEFYGACRRYAMAGAITFSVQYRLSKDSKGNVPIAGITPVECVKDARSAMRWVREHASEFSIDPQKIVVGGQSVGGHLSYATAYIDQHNEATDNLNVSPMPNAIISYSGTANCMEAWCDMLLGEKRNQIWSISPAHNVKKGMPPTLAFHGKEDNIVPLWTVQFFKNDTEKLGNHFEFVTYEGRKHYLGMGNKTYSNLFDEEILQKTDDFLRRLGFLK